MANHKSAIKQHKKSTTKGLINRSVQTQVKTSIKKFMTALTENNYSKSCELFNLVQSKMMKARKKNIFKMNKVSRQISLLSKKLKSIEINTK